MTQVTRRMQVDCGRGDTVRLLHFAAAPLSPSSGVGVLAGTQGHGFITVHNLHFCTLTQCYFVLHHVMGALVTGLASAAAIIASFTGAPSASQVKWLVIAAMTSAAAAAIAAGGERSVTRHCETSRCHRPHGAEGYGSIITDNPHLSSLTSMRATLPVPQGYGSVRIYNLHYVSSSHGVRRCQLVMTAFVTGLASAAAIIASFTGARQSPR